MCARVMAVVALSVGLLAATVSWGGEAEAVVERLAAGRVDWTVGVVEAMGQGAPPPKRPLEAQAPQTTWAAADRAARRNLLAVIDSLRVQADVDVGRFTADKLAVRAELDKMVQAAAVVKQEYLSDTSVEVTVRLSIFGGFSQLILPPEIKQIEPIKALGPQGGKAGGGARTDPPPAAPFTGLVIDARGLPVVPALAPLILDENGAEVFGPAIVSREFSVQRGVAGYVRDPASEHSSARVGPNPLTFKGLRLRENGSPDIVISNADAAKLRNAAEHLSFLKECRLVIVTAGAATDEKQ